MSDAGMTGSWGEIIRFPLGERTKKPRRQGLTMIIDKGLGPEETGDILQVGGEYIDFWKLGFGTAALYAPEMLEKKIKLVRSYGIDIYPGGTFLEVSVLQQRLDDFLHQAKKLGFTAVEISDGTITMSDATREWAIVRAADLGFKVLTEVGKKDRQDNQSVDELAGQIKRDLQCGAYRVILEGRESGINVGLYDEYGRLIRDSFEALLSGLDDPGALIWEAPLKDQQRDLIIRFGANVNLGNIPPGEVLALEALRVGLRADTLEAALSGRAAG